MTDKFNDYFTNIANNLIQTIENNNTNNNFLNHEDRLQSSCFLYPTNIVEVSEMVMSLPDKGNPMFCIPPRILCLIREKILPILTYLINFCFSKGIYPDCLKIARVVPICKSGSLLNVGNYRPISNLDPINKIFEKIIYDRLNKFVTKNNILSEFQIGFRLQSTLHLLLLIYIMISSQL